MKENNDDQLLEDLIKSHNHVKSKLDLSIREEHHDWKSTKHRRIMRSFLKELDRCLLEIVTRVNIESLTNLFNDANTGAQR